MEKKYPINMWAKLTRVVWDTKEIHPSDKDRFIEIVGNKVASYRNQKYPRRYKPQTLPSAIYKAHPELHLENYHTILNFTDEKLKPILVEIYNINYNRWFMGGR